MEKTVITLVIEFDGPGPRIGLRTPITVDGQPARPLSLAFYDAVEAKEVLHDVVQDVANGHGSTAACQRALSRVERLSRPRP